MLHWLRTWKMRAPSAGKSYHLPHLSHTHPLTLRHSASELAREQAASGGSSGQEPESG
jgi:hypothetical protein